MRHMGDLAFFIHASPLNGPSQPACVLGWLGRGSDQEQRLAQQHHSPQQSQNISVLAASLKPVSSQTRTKERVVGSSATTAAASKLLRNSSGAQHTASSPAALPGTLPGSTLVIQAWVRQYKLDVQGFEDAD